jgi:pyruvate,water dikinase
VVESILGLGEMIMRGSITPDHFEVDRRTFRIVSKQVVPQEKQLIKIAGSTKTSPVPKAKMNEQKVSDSVIVRVAKLGIKLQEHYKKPQVIEWAYSDGRIHIFEAKTLEDIDGSSMHRHGVAIDPTENRQPLLSGACANSGVVMGKVALIKNTHDSNDFKAGSILVTSVISFDQMTILKKASAVITDEGGQTSDAAILCRELGIPCIVGTGKATKILKNNDKITVDATRGLIFAGEKKPQKITIALPSGAESIRDVQTTVHIVVNASEPEMAQMISQRYVDGIGLLQPEFIISEYIGVHPQSLIEKGRRKFFIDKLAEEVSTFCENFGARPILYKLSDLKAYERKALQGGEKFEVDEKNPLLGLHGCAQMLSSEETVAMELEALKKVREKMGHTNLHVAIPYVRTVDELKEVKSLMAKHGLARRHNFKLYMMAQVPNNVFMLDEYIDVGIDGVFADLTSLHALTVGIDAENERVAKGYATKDAGLARVLEIIIKTAKRRGVRSYVGGNLDVVTADTLKKSIEWGVSGISVKPGLEEYMRLVAYDIENRDKRHAKKGPGISLRKLIGL